MTRESAILEAMQNGRRITSYEANRIGHTVDSRKVISDLRRKGFKISDYWMQGADGRRFKVYFLTENTMEL